MTIALVFFMFSAFCGALYVLWDHIFPTKAKLEDRAAKEKSEEKVKSLTKQVNLLEKMVESKTKENRFLLDVIELGLPYPTVEQYESDQLKIKQLIEKELNATQE